MLPAVIEGVEGLIAIETRAGPVTVRVAVPVMLSAVAVMEVDPAALAVAIKAKERTDG